MTYFENLQAMKANRENIRLRDIGDEWRTPDPLYWGINQLYGPFILDLFTDGENAKCGIYYTAEDNALAQPWSEQLNGGVAFANPPYSRSSYDEHGSPTTGMRHIVAKAMAERELGARVVFLIKVATSETWWPEHADHICWIKGRVKFELPQWAGHLEASSAGFGQAVVVFDKHWKGERERYIARDLLEAQGQALMDAIERRAQELAAQLVPTMGALSTEPGPISPEQVPLSTEQPPEPESLSTELTEEEDEPTEFTLQDIRHLWLSGELQADCWLTFLTSLLILFGEHPVYHALHLRAAMVVEAADSTVRLDCVTERQQHLITVIAEALGMLDIPGELQVDAVLAVRNREWKLMLTSQQLTDREIRQIINDHKQEVTA